MPWPSSLYLAEDTTRTTGYTLRFGPTSFGPNVFDDYMLPDAWSVLDGYGTGTPVVVSFPNIDTTGMAAEDNIGASLEAASSVLWFELDENGNVVGRVPHWAELDSTSFDPAEQALFVRPAVILKEATRYVVAFRNLRTTQGVAIEPTEAFRRLSTGKTGGDPQLAPRQARFDDVFAVLESEGISRSELVLAWDFVTASCDALHGTMLSVRDQGLAAAGAQGPQITITNVTQTTPVQDPDIAFAIEGTLVVPNFLQIGTIREYESEHFSRDADGNVVQNGTREIPFWLRIPHSAVDGNSTPHDLLIYGHGLLGSGAQVRGGFLGRIANQHNLITFATDLTGMSEDNFIDAINALNDISRFEFMADQQHQGLFHFMLLARTMQGRLQATVDATLETQGLGITVSGDMYYSGISQGGIFGATFMALTPDIARGHLGVPGNNYSTMLARSVDFNGYAIVLRNAYLNTLDQAIGKQLVGLLWERTDPVSYMRHISAEPFPGNDPHHVLLVPAKGDYQVATITNEIAARSDIAIGLLENYGRPVWGVAPTPYPHTGSGVVLYDFGNPWPALGNFPPSDGLGDPHGKPRQEDHHNAQMMQFFRSGQIVDVCGGDGCTPD